jgi:hypothetical protein
MKDLVLKKQCGKCDKWMLLGRCPREYPVYGGHRGPAMNDGPCANFKWAAHYAEKGNAQDMALSLECSKL